MRPGRTGRRQRLAVGAVMPLALLAAGCGTTVSERQQAAAGGPPPGVATGGGGSTSGGSSIRPDMSLEGSSPADGLNAPQPGAPSTTTGAAPGGVSGGAGPDQPSQAPPRTNVAITEPLTIGLLGASAVGGAAGSIGADSDQGLSPSQAQQAVAESYKKAGLAGRRLRTVVAEIDPSGDYQQQLNAACATFTQDDRVDVVVSSDALNDELMANCLGKARIPRISTGYGSGNAASFVSYPLSRHVGAPNADRRMATLITRSAAAGTLTTASRVGVIVEDCPRNRSAYEKTVAPALKKVGVASTTAQFAECINGFGSAGSASAATSGAVLSFASRQVDTVMFVSNFEGTLLLFFSQAAENQGYRPRYQLTSASGAAVLRDSLPSNQVRNMGGWGWLPSLDVTRGNTASTSSQHACVARLRKVGKSPRSSIDHAAAYGACDGFAALERALQGARGDSSADRLLSALDAASPSLSLASLVDGRIVLDARRHDGPARVQAFTYQLACGCFTYVGSRQDMSS